MIRDELSSHSAQATQGIDIDFLCHTLDSLPMEVALLDESGDIILVNEAWRRFAAENGGRDPTCGVGSNYIEVTRRSDTREAAEIARGIRAVLAGEIATFDLEYPCHGPEEERWYSMRVCRYDAPGLHCALVIHRNVTERVLAEKALRRREEWYRALIENASDIVIIMNSEGRIIHASPSIRRELGYQPEELLGRHIEEFLRPEELALTSGMLAEAFEHPGATGRIEHHFLHKDGSWSMLESVGKVVRTPGSGSLRAILNSRDITHRRRREQELTALVEVTTALRRARGPEEMIPIILEQLMSLFDAGGAALARTTANGKTEVVEARGVWKGWTGGRLEPGEGVVAHVLATGESFVTNEATGEPLFGRRVTATLLRSVACVPLIAHGQVLGAVWLGRRQAITDSTMRLLNAICDMAASALQRSTLHKQTERRLHRLGALREIDRVITSSVDLNLVLGVVLDQVRIHLDVDAASLLLFNANEYSLSYAGGRGFKSDTIARSHIRMGQGVAGRAALVRELVYVEDLRGNPEFSRTTLHQLEGFVTHFAAPLLSRGQLKGVLEVFHRSPLDVDDEWRDFFETLAGQAAIAIESAMLFEAMERSNSELFLAYEATIEGWSHALDFRDRETEGHSQRVTAHSIQLAKAMGVHDEELVHLRRGALLHDIGKMGIPDQILLKPGPLTPSEWDIMRRHPTYAYQLLSRIDYLRPSLDIPYCHHERWDGGGYPRGLRGEEIPLAARIFAVVDVWDALTSDRPYRSAWSQKKALDYIQSQAGTHFDPRVVDAFLQLLVATEEVRKASILISDPDPDVIRSLQRLLEPEYTVYCAQQVPQALDIIEGVELDLVVTELRLAEGSGVDLLTRAKRLRPDLVGILMAEDLIPESLTAALNLGTVRGFVQKPLDERALLRKIADLVSEPARVPNYRGIS